MFLLYLDESGNENDPSLRHAASVLAMVDVAGIIATYVEAGLGRQRRKRRCRIQRRTI